MVYAAGLIAVGCASQPVAPAQQRAEALRLGDPVGPPSLRALPEISKARSEQLHRGLAQAGEVFASQLPAAPPDRAYIELAAWVEEEVAQWVIARRDGVDETRFQFDTSAHSDPAAHAVTNAVIGLLHEDTARSLARIPMPKELESEPEIAALFRELVDTQAAPFLHAARIAYGHCAEHADDADDDRFERFCRARAEALERPLDAPPPQPLAAAHHSSR